MEDLAVLHTKVAGCMEAAGVATGCTAELEWQGDHNLFDHEECHLRSTINNDCGYRVCVMS